MEGTLAWNDEKLTIRRIVKGEYVFESLSVGQTLEVFQNGCWHQVEVQSIHQEPFFKDWNYGNGIGCDARTV